MQPPPTATHPVDAPDAPGRAPDAPGPAPDAAGRPAEVPSLVKNLWDTTRGPLAFKEGTEPRAGGHRDAAYRRALALADAFAVAAALGAAVLLGDSGEALTPAALLVLPLAVLVNKIVGLYERDAHVIHRTTLEEAPRIFEVATLLTILLWLSEGVFIQGDIGRKQVLVLWGLLFVLMVFGRSVARRAARSVTPTERLLVVGDQHCAERLRRKAETAEETKLAVVGRVTFGEGRRRGEDRLSDVADCDVPVLGAIDELPALVNQHGIERVVIAPGPLPSDDVLDLIRFVKFVGVKVTVLPSLLEVVGSSVEVDDLEGMPLLGLRRWGLTRSSALLKRAVDVVVSALLLVLFAPLAAAIALVIKLDSRGPVLFRQPRIGKHDRQFDIVKFRTMHCDAEERKQEIAELNEADGLFKIKDDPRLTRVGRVLRRLSLDELPQLLNVLRGEMSLVGPRPLVPDEDSRVTGWSRRRLEVVPGMTGQWQVLGSARVPLPEMAKIDYLYGANWSLWGDFKILLRTAAFVLKRRGL